MEHHVVIGGRYCRGYESASRNWKTICAEHEDEFPQIHECQPGTVNVILNSPYIPPEDAKYRQMARVRGQSIGRYRDGNHLSPLAKVIRINGKPVEAWIYRGGHRDGRVLELVSSCRVAEQFSLTASDPVTLEIVEFSEEGSPGMPGPPPSRPGKRVPLA